MKHCIYILFSVLFLLLRQVAQGQVSSGAAAQVVIAEQGVLQNRVALRWKKAIESRMSTQRFDSISRLERPLSDDEKGWIDLISSRMSKWNTYRDSLEIPFNGSRVPDTVYVLMGAFGPDDGFTYQYNTVCFDLTALTANYGAAGLLENNERIDRLYAHEYTHLIHKTWAMQHKLELKSFRDSVLWECIYEGIGMYRSLSKRWLPQKGVLPDITKNALEKLYPVFVENVLSVESLKNFADEEKRIITANLSRGPVAKKWGAFTVAIWLALEANGNDQNLQPIINEGLNSILSLAEKYLPENHKKQMQERNK